MLFRPTTFLSAAIALASLVTTNAVPAPGGETALQYVTGFPICGERGWHSQAEFYLYWRVADSGLELEDCMNICKDLARTGACQAIEHTAMGRCTLFNAPVQSTALVQDDYSQGVSYDAACPGF